MITDISLEDNDIKKCKLVRGALADIAQVILIAVVILSLVYKRWYEKPQRPFKIWAFDVSKQALSSLLNHIFNIMLSIFVSIGYSHTSECSWYFVVYLVDNTLGVALTLMLHSFVVGFARRHSPVYKNFIKNSIEASTYKTKSQCKSNSLILSQRASECHSFDFYHSLPITYDGILPLSIPSSPKSMLSLCILKEPTVLPVINGIQPGSPVKSLEEIKRESLCSYKTKESSVVGPSITDIVAMCGYYGVPPSYFWWAIQMIEWISVVCVARAVIGAFDYIFRNIGLVIVASKTDKLFSGHPSSLLLFVLVIFPFVLNIVQAWIKDACLKHRADVGDSPEIFTITQKVKEMEIFKQLIYLPVSGIICQ